MLNATGPTPRHDPHNSPHQAVDVHTLADPWALVYEISDFGLHVQLRLVYSEAGDEILGCLESDHTVPEDGWGFVAEDVMEMVCHVVWHMTTGVLPGRCEGHDDV